jgi:hypothetical protein
LLSLIAILVEILPIILFVVFRKRNIQGGLWVILLSVILSVLADWTYIIGKGHINKLYLHASFTIIEYSLFSLFLYLSFSKKSLKTILVFASLGFYIVAGSNFLNKANEEFDSLSASAEAVLIIVYSIFYLYEQVNDPSVLLVYNTKKFWIVLAFLIYFSSTLFLFIYASAMTNQEHKSYWNINNFFDELKNVLFSIGFVMRPDKKNRYTSETPYLDPN